MKGTITPPLLIVDDEIEMRGILRSMIEERFEFEVSEAESAFEAISRFALCEFQFILSDLQMTNGSGLDLFHYIRNRPEIDAHFIMFTGAADLLPEAQRDEFIAIEKPNFRELIDAIDFLGGRRAS